MWACNNMPDQASVLSEKHLETMETTHLISTLAKAQTSGNEEAIERRDEEEEINL